MSDIPGTVPIKVRCGCPERRVPLHLTWALLQVLSRSKLPADFVVGSTKCVRCRMVTPILLGDLPVVRLAG